ncbi:variable surface protein [Plasmodium gonderi]|uniref:Variable surface protein n=1 Tax=Plasmodium gonderi TaxID=77519 RepID=A0A1Y1JWD6_PLAGO|nr:variable surface protein [Plasmodium gonderi]GAW84174.1 variable surface protein [Plasmodium gonderi]
MTKTTATLSLEEAAKSLKLNEMFEEFFANQETFNYQSYCNKVETYDSKYDGVSDLCRKLVGFLEKVHQNSYIKMHKDYCDYLTYWLHDKVGEIYTSTSEKTADIPFFKGLIDVINTVNGKVKEHKCKIQYDYETTLDEWRNRKFTYIYLKKYNDIKKGISAKTKDNCNTYITYINNIHTLYKKYKGDCKLGIFWYSGPNYADCSFMYNPDKLISTLNDCNDEERTHFVDVGMGSSTNREVLESGKREKAESSPNPRQEGLSSSLDSSGKPHLPSPPDEDGKLDSPIPQEVSSYLEIPLVSSKLILEPSGREESLDHRDSEYSKRGPYIQQGNYDHHHADSTSILIPYEGSTVSSNFFQKIYDILNSNNLRHTIMCASIVVVVIFLIFFFSSTLSGSLLNKCDEKKRDYEKDSCDRGEEEFSGCGTELQHTNSHISDVYLSYQPRRDYYG